MKSKIAFNNCTTSEISPLVRGKKKKNKECNSQNESDDIPQAKMIEKETSHTTPKMFSHEVNSFMDTHSIITSEPTRPIISFDDLEVKKRVKKICSSFKKPTPIQSMCWPIILSGRDTIGIAETGSGKTLAFLIPGIQLVIEKKKSEGESSGKSVPRMLVISPTRELAMQSQKVFESAAEICKIKSTCLYGGVSKYEQKVALRSGIDVIVATPGRLLDFIDEGECDLSNVEYLVLDEADRMLDQGFEPVIRSIIKNTPHKSDRRTCLFSATWPTCVEKLAFDFLQNPIKVTIGSEDLAAGKRVTQLVEVVDERSRDMKLNALLHKYHNGSNKILVFVLYKKEAERVFHCLLKNKWKCEAIHGDRSQDKRTEALENFKCGKVPILIATDVAARGLDIPDVEYVINYSFPLTIEDYVHRIGRTGRAGRSGISHTFFHSGDKLRAGELVKVLKDSNQHVPAEMNQFDLNVKRKEHKMYGNFGPKSYNHDLKKAKHTTFD